MCHHCANYPICHKLQTEMPPPEDLNYQNRMAQIESTVIKIDKKYDKNKTIDMMDVR